MNWIIAVVMSCAVGFVMADKSGIVVAEALGRATWLFAFSAIASQIVAWSYKLFRKPFSRAQFFSVYWVTWVLSVWLTLGGRSIEGPETVSSTPLVETESPVTAAPNDVFSADTIAGRIERAEQGEVSAQSLLADLYKNGWGVPQDHIQAHMWYNLAASSSGDDGAREAAINRDLIAEEMTSEQISEAQRLAREWKPKSSGSQLLVAGTVAQSSITAADFEVYRDSEYGFTFWYPKTWLSVPTTHSRTRIKVVSDNGLGEEDCLSGVHYSKEIKDLSSKDFITSVSKPEGILALQRYMRTIYADYELLEHHHLHQ